MQGRCRGDLLLERGLEAEEVLVLAAQLLHDGGEQLRLLGLLRVRVRVRVRVGVRVRVIRLGFGGEQLSLRTLHGG